MDYGATQFLFLTRGHELYPPSIFIVVCLFMFPLRYEQRAFNHLIFRRDSFFFWLLVRETRKICISIKLITTKWRLRFGRQKCEIENSVSVLGFRFHLRCLLYSLLHFFVVFFGEQK